MDHDGPPCGTKTGDTADNDGPPCDDTADNDWAPCRATTGYTADNDGPPCVTRNDNSTVETRTSHTNIDIERESPSLTSCVSSVDGIHYSTMATACDIQLSGNLPRNMPDDTNPSISDAVHSDMVEGNRLTNVASCGKMQSTPSTREMYMRLSASELVSDELSSSSSLSEPGFVSAEDFISRFLRDEETSSVTSSDDISTTEDSWDGTSQNKPAHFVITSVCREVLLLPVTNLLTSIIQISNKSIKQ